MGAGSVRGIEGQRGGMCRRGKSGKGGERQISQDLRLSLESASSTSNWAWIKRSWGLRYFCRAAANTGSHTGLD